MKWVSDTFGVHSKMHEINNTFLANALVTGDWSVNAVQKIQLTGEQVSKQATITAAIVTTTSAMADKMSKPEPHPNPDNSRRDLTDEEKIKYRRPSSLRPGTRDEIWERSKSQDGTVYDPHTGRPISDGEPWDAGHKPEYKFSEAQKDAAQRGITRKEFLEEQNNPNLYRAERPIINQSHEAEGPPEQFRTGMPSATTPNVPEYENIERK